MAIGQKIRIRLKGYDYKLLDESAAKIVETVKRSGARVSGPIPLPTSINKFTVLRSPHVDKKSREQFEMRIHKRLIDLGLDERALRLVMRIPVPEGLNIEIEMIDA